jgi:hypothetical protein
MDGSPDSGGVPARWGLDVDRCRRSGTSSAIHPSRHLHGEKRAARPGGSETSTESYWAFWSDTSHHFLAQYLFPVSPGDKIFASLVLADGQWLPTIDDLSSSFSTRDEARASFRRAEWAQEHVIVAGDGDGYPRLSTVTFSDLEVNSADPSHAGLYSLSMTLTGQGHIAPSALVGDSFAVGQPTPGSS